MSTVVGFLGRMEGVHLLDRRGDVSLSVPFDDAA
jgi:hypothetical protein